MHMLIAELTTLLAKNTSDQLIKEEEKVSKRNC